MTASQATRKFIDQLRFLGVELWVEGERLRYSAPKGVINDDVLDEMRTRKSEILACVKAEDSVTRDSPVVAVPRTELMPLSFAQQRIWFLDELEADNPFYNVALAKRIRGFIDADLLRRSLLTLIQRHEVLRASCVTTDAGPRLKITSPDEIAPEGDWLTVEDLPPECSEAELQQHVDSEVRPALPLHQAPLLRCRLFRRGASDAVLTFTTHHFVVDGWSCGILMRELSVVYTALAADSEPDLPELPVQYPDFSAWQNRWLKGPEPTEQIAYWKEQLEGLGSLDLPTDKSRPAIQSYRGDIHHFSLPAKLGTQLKELSRSQGVTLYMTLLAAFQVLLHRYSQQDEVILGTAVSNRISTALEGILGPFVNTLVLRSDLSANPVFLDLVAKTRDMAAGAFAHQDLPFENLVEELKPERDRSRSPLFQILFVVHQYSGDEELAIPETTTSDFPVAPGTTMYDLFLQLIELNGELSGSIEYSTDLFTHETIIRMVSHLETLLGGIGANPTARILDLPLMDEAEARRVREGWNATAADYPATARIETLFEAQVNQSPDNTAILHCGKSLTYAELNGRANQLAALLAESGVTQNDLVGIYCDRSIEMMVALLATLKAGAAYVPLDPLFPADRIAFMMEDADLAALLTQTSRVGDLAHTPPLTICMDGSVDKLANMPDANPESIGKAADLAYIIYTSGSTGLPKGVQLEHRSVINFLCTMADHPGIGADDTLVAVTTLSFDIAVLELLLPLLNGARLVIADKDVAADGERLAQLINDSNTTIMQATPATWQLLLNADWSGKADLRILCGGEALPRELADRLLPICGELWNMYGPTETTIWSAISKVTTDGPIAIGRPIANTQIYVVDAELRPVPVGVPGELCIAGDGVARGYLNRPELTAEHFVDNPFGTDQSMLYRTGDLARYLSDGQIQCLGRNDNQIKIHGYRIELGEIETALAGHKAVNQAVVSAREDREGEKRLVGYLIADTTAMDSGQLEQWKNDQLDQWRDLWQNAYTEGQTLDPGFNISGWLSSYTGEPIPTSHMREWVEATAERINAYQADRILEIGCGTGLIVARTAANCSRYLAIDFSPASIAAVDHLCASRNDMGSVETRQLGADQLDKLAGERFDLVVINSVTQYFPDQGYLLDVIKQLCGMLTDGGQIFMGDLRSLTLMEAYHTSVQLWRAEGDLDLANLAERVRQRIEQEEELLVDPAFFQQLTDLLPAINKVELQLKRGESRNEMSCFRYDATLTVGNRRKDNLEPRREEWHIGLDVTEISGLLENSREIGLLLLGVADARLQPEIVAMSELFNADAGKGDRITDELRTSISATDMHGIQPEELYTLANSANMAVQMTGTAPGRYNALFCPRDASIDGRILLPSRDITLEQCCNNPMQGRIQRNLVPALKDHLRRSLPEYMVPAVFTLLDKFPLTPNGKIDRKALPAPDSVSNEVYTPPRNEPEERLVEIWETLLGVDQIGVLDDFFGLGGHSLLATQMISRIRDQFGISLPLNSLFDTPTVAGLAAALDTLSWALDNASPDSGTDQDLEEIEI